MGPHIGPQWQSTLKENHAGMYMMIFTERLNSNPVIICAARLNSPDYTMIIDGNEAIASAARAADQLNDSVSGLKQNVLY
jgi:hypothetical protein